MTYDCFVPERLKSIQQWFAGIITQPIDDENRIHTITPNGKSIFDEAPLYIAPSPTLEPAQRIELYNQQYWWRLLSNMQESFPLVTRLFGRYAFNKMIAFPYLQKHPPSHWSLSYIGKYLSQWIKEEYHENDKALVLDAVHVDYAYLTSFLENQETLILEPETLDLAEKKLHLQPHVQLFCFPYNLFQFRIEFLKQEPDYWLEKEFPSLEPIEEKAYFVLFRHFSTLQVMFQQVSENEYKLLERFKHPHSVDALCEWLEGQTQDSSLYEEAQSHLHLWFQRWVGQQWLYRLKF